MTVTATNPFANISGISTSSGSTSTTSSGSTSAALTSTGASPISVSGLASGINSAAIINALVAANGAATDVIKGEMNNTQVQENALADYNTKMLQAQLDLAPLQTPATFQTWQATTSNPAALSATSAGGSAVPGTYELNVLQVAQAEQLATAGQSSATASVGAGTIELQVGTGPATSLDFSSGGSLNDIATAINNANIGIIASVVNDGSATPNRLILQSSNTGAANTILATGTGSLASLFTGMTTLTNAQDAQISIGGSQAGTSAITLDQASNTFTNVVPGINLTATQQASDITVNVSSDPTTAVAAITKFVTDYNAAVTDLNGYTAYNSSTNSGGPLISDSDLRANLDAITEALTSAVPGLPSTLNNFNSLGITINQADGTLSIDSATLSAAVAANPEGVMNMFTNGATSTNSAVQYANLTSATDVTQPFKVNITQAASQAVVAATGPLASSTTIDDSNNQLDMAINGSEVQVTLTNGTYTPAQLASQVQSAVNAAVPDAGDDVAVSVDGSALDLRSLYYGSNQSIQLLSSASAATLGLSTDAAQGLDVAGTINGVAATGSGQLLTGASGTAADGLSLLVTAIAPVSGVTVNAYKGIAEQANDIFNQATDSSTGMLSTEETALNTSITDYQTQITNQDAILAQQKTLFEQEFTQMETLISSYQNQTTYLNDLSNDQVAASGTTG
jgi:flagellar hook-associated protein 2